MLQSLSTGLIKKIITIVCISSRQNDDKCGKMLTIGQPGGSMEVLVLFLQLFYKFEII